MEPRGGQLGDPARADQPDRAALQARDRAEGVGVRLLAAVQCGVEVADPSHEHRGEHDRVVGDDVGAVVRHVAHVDAGGRRRAEVDIVDPDAVADHDGVVGQSPELIASERDEVREHHVRVVEGGAELDVRVCAAVLRPGLLGERSLEVVVSDRGVGDGDDAAHAAFRPGLRGQRAEQVPHPEVPRGRLLARGHAVDERAELGRADRDHVAVVVGEAHAGRVAVLDRGERRAAEEHEAVRVLVAAADGMGDQLRDRARDVALRRRGLEHEAVGALDPHRDRGGRARPRR